MDSPDLQTPERQIPFDLLELPRVSRWERWGRWLRKYGERALYSLGCLTVLGFILAPVGIWSHGPGHRVSCLSNVKQIGLGILMYSQDYDDRYMPKVGWVESALPYIKNEGVFRCPELEKSERYGYALNGVLSRRRMERA